MIGVLPEVLRRCLEQEGRRLALEDPHSGVAYQFPSLWVEVVLPEWDMRLEVSAPDVWEPYRSYPSTAVSEDFVRDVELVAANGDFQSSSRGSQEILDLLVDLTVLSSSVRSEAREREVLVLTCRSSSLGLVLAESSPISPRLLSLHSSDRSLLRSSAHLGLPLLVPSSKPPPVLIYAPILGVVPKSVSKRAPLQFHSKLTVNCPVWLS